MSCCNKKIQKVVHISQGQISALAEKIFNIQIMKCDKYQHRYNICSGCNKRTYMTKTEYAEWLINNGKDIIGNFTELEKLPALPKMDKRDNTLMFCRLCKCELDAKCRVKDERCPLGRWS